MGWCSATDIIDTAIRAADELLDRAYDALGVDPDRVTVDDIRPHMDDVLRPFVATLATRLRDEDWDCEEESDYFRRFPQEMLGYDDDEFQEFLVHQVKDHAGTAEWDHWVGVLAAWTARKAQQGTEGPSDG